MCESEYKKKCDNFDQSCNSLINRIAGISRDDLRDQLEEEYKHNINQFCQINIDYANSIYNSIKTENCNIVRVIENAFDICNNQSLSKISDTYRLRIPKNIAQLHQWKHIMDSLHGILFIYNNDREIIESIGIGNNIFYIVLNGKSIDNYDGYIIC